MQVDVKSGWLVGVRQCPSPHVDDRPDGMSVDLLVVHAISLPPGQFGGDDVLNLFMGSLDVDAHPFYAQLSGVRVSAHVFIQRDGTCVQFVPFHRRAWHAGVSRFGSREQCNHFSIGIELEGTETSAFTAAQYACLRALIAALRTAYESLQRAPVVGHSDIAPLRKQDPGLGFDWSRLDDVSCGIACVKMA